MAGGKKGRTIVAWLALFVAAEGNARSSSATPVSIVQRNRPATGAPSVRAWIDLRPSWVPGTGRWHGFHTADAAVALSRRSWLGYQQQIFQNLHGASSLTGGSAVAPFDGFLYAQLNRIDLGSEYRLTFSFEPRLYVPTHGVKRDQGFLTQARLYLRLESEVSRQLSFQLISVPILHVYSRAGTGGASPGDPGVANPLFEHRLYLAASATSPDGRWSLYFPIIFSTTRYSSFAAGASRSDSWDAQLWIYPELLYRATRNLSVGLGYESSDFLSSAGAAPDFSSALALGSAQLIFRVDF